MIVCHPRKLIFIKTLKVGGTSLEMALSKYCSSDCVITPISKSDEAERTARGWRGAQNYVDTYWPSLDKKSDGKFFNHIPARKAKRLIPNKIWNSYTKFSIYRDPFDQAVSRYFWQIHRHGEAEVGSDFLAYLKANPRHLTSNARIAPLEGKAKLDHYLRYDRLEEDMKAIGLGDVWEVFRSLKAKSGLRPERGTGVAEYYARFPGAAEHVSEMCVDEIDHFGWTIPR